jgi:hypothetical protein
MSKETASENDTEKLNQIDMVYANDWMGVYYKGNLITEGHSIPLFDILPKLGFTIKEQDADNEWLEEQGNLPKDFKDVKIGKGEY